MTSLAASAAAPPSPRRLEVVDGPRAQLDRERDRTRLRELVAVQAQREPRVAAGRQVAACLRRVERPALEEDVRGLRELSRLRQHLVDEELDVRLGAGVRELGRDRVRAEPGRDAARVHDRAQLRELRVVVEPVAGLRLEGRRACLAHPADVFGEPVCELGPRSQLASRAPWRGSRRRARAAPRTKLRPREARTPRRGRRRSTRAYGSRRGRESPTGPRPSTPRRVPGPTRGRPLRPTRRRDRPSQRTYASSITVTSRSAAPRSGAPLPDGEATCARSRIRSRGLMRGSTAGRPRTRGRRRALPRSRRRRAAPRPSRDRS